MNAEIHGRCTGCDRELRAHLVGGIPPTPLICPLCGAEICVAWCGLTDPAAVDVPVIHDDPNTWSPPMKMIVLGPDVCKAAGLEFPCGPIPLDLIEESTAYMLRNDPRLQKRPLIMDEYTEFPAVDPAKARTLLNPLPTLLNELASRVVAKRKPR